MIIDVHTHVFPKDICRNRESCFEGEAAFRLLYDSPKSPMADAEDLIAAMDAAGVDISVTFGFPWQQPELIRRHNDYVMESVVRYPDRLLGLCCVDGTASDAAAEVRRCLDAGMSGVGELAFYESGIKAEHIDRLSEIMALCRERNVPVMIHTNEPVGHKYPGKTCNTLAQIYSLISAYPENRIILAHWGGGIFFYLLLKKEVQEAMANVWFDTAASPFLYDPGIYPAAAAAAGAEKILLGTDYPLIRVERYLSEIEQTALTDTDRQLICGENAVRLFDISITNSDQ